MNNITQIKNKIYTIRNTQVMLDEDLAEFYQVETKRFNEQVKRNLERFPTEFMFQLTQEEYEILKSQFATSSWGGRRHLPYAFTEQGISMLSAVLHSKIAIKTSIQIINTFVQMRKFLQANHNTFQRLHIIETKLLEHDNILNSLETTKPKVGIFFNGEFFDSYVFIIDLIKQAKTEIILIDNYISEKTLDLFKNKIKEVKVTIYTKAITKELLEIKSKFNQQYGNLEIKKFTKSHDRFLLLDKQVYHIGSSLKDIGYKWTAFSRMDDFYQEIISKTKPKTL